MISPALILSTRSFETGNFSKNNGIFHFHSVQPWLRKGAAFPAILIEPDDMKKYDYLRLPATDTWGLLMKRDSPLAALEMIRPEDLRNIPLLCSKQTLVKNEISGWLRDDYDKLNIVATYNLIYNASLMVEEGVGYALCLDKLVNTTGSSSLCFRPLEPGLEANLDMVWKKYQVFSKAAEKFLEKIQEEINAVSSYVHINYPSFSPLSNGSLVPVHAKAAPAGIIPHWKQHFLLRRQHCSGLRRKSFQAPLSPLLRILLPEMQWRRWSPPNPLPKQNPPKPSS